VASYPDEVWHVDLMYLWVKETLVFLVTVLDSYSRYVVHWELARLSRLVVRDKGIALLYALPVIFTAIEELASCTPPHWMSSSSG